MRLLFALPRLNLAGGVYIVVKMAEALAAAGHRVTLAVWEPGAGAGPGWLSIPPAVPVAPFETAAAAEYDVAFATWWELLFGLPRFRARTYAHCVQALESAFYPWGDARQALHEHLLASGAFPSLCTARWLLPYASQPAYCVLAGLDRAVFRPVEPILPRTPARARFLVEGPRSSPRKHVPETIALLERLGVEYLAVGEDASKAAAGPHCLGAFALPLAAMPRVYAAADVLVKCSSAEGMFAPPLEMFACGGTAVCWDVPGAEEYLVDGVNALLAPMNGWGAVADAVERLAGDPALLARLRAGARATAEAWPSWPEVAPLLAAAVERIAAVDNHATFPAVVAEARARFAWSPPARAGVA